jgi:hypothetical protein
MGLALVRLPAYDVNLVICSGRLTGDELVRFCSELDPDDPTLAPRWLTSIDENADFSGLPVTAFPKTKHILEPKLKRLREPPGYRSAIVCKTAHCELVTDFWQAYVERGPEYPSHPAFFHELKDACDWLELPEAGCEAIRAQHAQLAPLP